tara:strand:- start:257 stop:433 length:177 start_codon:yes stop_codon:yes gene_type:complete
MTLRELERLLFQARQHHTDDELICIFNRDTSERIDIQFVDDMIDGEVRLVVKENNNEH